MADKKEDGWTITVTQALPDCPSVYAAWERIATQTKWQEWRSESPMRGNNVVTTTTAVEPLHSNDEYTVRVSPFMSIQCRVLESSAEEEDTMVFDAEGKALCGLVKARFRFTMFQENGLVMARAQEHMDASCSFLSPSKEVLENEHRHTLKDLNQSFVSQTAS